VCEVHRGGDAAIELADALMIAVEHLEKARLRAGRPLHATERQRGAPVIQVHQVEHEILHPERRPLAHGRELRRLQVRVA